MPLWHEQYTTGQKRTETKTILNKFVTDHEPIDGANTAVALIDTGGNLLVCDDRKKCPEYVYTGMALWGLPLLNALDTNKANLGESKNVRLRLNETIKDGPRTKKARHLLAVDKVDAPADRNELKNRLMLVYLSYDFQIPFFEMPFQNFLSSCTRDVRKHFKLGEEGERASA